MITVSIFFSNGQYVSLIKSPSCKFCAGDLLFEGAARPWSEAASKQTPDKQEKNQTLFPLRKENGTNQLIPGY